MNKEKSSQITENTFENEDKRLKNDKIRRNKTNHLKIVKKFRISFIPRNHFSLKSADLIKSSEIDLDDVNELFLRQKADSRLKFNNYELKAISKLITGLNSHNFSSQVTNINYQPFFHYEIFSNPSVDDEKEDFMKVDDNIDNIKNQFLSSEFEFVEEE